MPAVTAIFAPPRELAHRSADGIDVTLMWDPRSDRAYVVVIDAKAGAMLEVDVAGANPMQVFHHPYAYCDRQIAA
jgi:carotenoid cleavage dioxygenase-like enzyme